MHRPPTGSARDVFPPGESLRRAIQWISDRRREPPDLPVYKLVDEASLRFDLSPPETQFLLENWRRLAAQDAGDT
jgi:hypothetical protein